MRAGSGSRGTRRLVYETLEPGSHSRAAQLADMVLIALVLVNVGAVVLESLPSVAAAYGPWFTAIERVSVAVFTAEYALRLWSAPEHAPLARLAPWQARLRFAVQPQSVVDLVAIVPVYAALFLGIDLRSLLILRLFRFFKLARYSPGIASLVDAFYTERRALMASLIILVGTALIAASLMYLVEGAAQPDKFGTIPAAMYWAAVTLTTVGYGDVVPSTSLGRVVAALTAVAGLVMLALPVGIVASAFAREIHRRDFVVTWSMVARVPLFAGLDAAEVSEVMRYLRSQSCEADEVVTRRGEPADAMYFITTGEVEIELADDRVILGAGEFFGEIGALRQVERSATARAISAAKLLVLDAADLRYLIDRSPRMAERIRKVAEQRTGVDVVSEALSRDSTPPPGNASLSRDPGAAGT